MKLLLTSAGVTNKTIATALSDLCGKPLKEIKLVYIPTAANLVEGDKWWLVDDYKNCLKLGLKEFDILDFSAVYKKVWLERYKNMDVLMVGGGNTSHLMHKIYEHGFDKEIPVLLKDKVYVGVSAGSHAASVDLFSDVSVDLFEESYEIIHDDKGLGLADLWVIPHFNSQYFENLRTKNVERAAKKVNCPVYVLDDESALIVDGEKVEVVSEGEWKKYN